MSATPLPRLIALAGSNGAGKSTTGPTLLKGTLGVTEFVNADLVAQGLSPLDPDGAAIAAGRIMLENFHRLYRPLASTWRIYDNSGSFAPQVIAHGGRGREPQISIGPNGEPSLETPTMKTEPKDIGEIFRDGSLIDKALREAALEAKRFHWGYGYPSVAWRGGEVVWTRADELEREPDYDGRSATLGP